MRAVLRVSRVFLPWVSHHALPRSLCSVPAMRQPRQRVLSASGPKDEPGLGEHNWFLQPHEIIALVLTVTLVIYVVFTRDTSNTAGNVKAGIAAACIIFLVFCATQMRDTGFMKRPHVVVWRVAKGITIIYLVGCVWLLFQKPEDARGIYAFVDSSLGQPLPERSYAEDCRIYTPENPDSKFANILGVIHDEFFVAHMLGWVFKMFLFRDVYVCWFLSIWFELLEYSFQHILPNFAECWWDHWIIDVAFCNAIGIWVGGIILRKIQGSSYMWVGHQEEVPATSAWQRVLNQFRPEVFTKFHWRIFESPRRWFGFWTLVTMVSIGELNAFFLKFVLWHPNTNIVVMLRLVVWFVFCLPAVRELYCYVDDPKQKRIGAFLWLTVAIALCEAMITLRFSKGQFPHLHGHPPLVVGIWAVFLIGLNIFTLFYFYIFQMHLRGKNGNGAKQASEMVATVKKTPRKRASSVTKRSKVE